MVAVPDFRPLPRPTLQPAPCRLCGNPVYHDIPFKTDRERAFTRLPHVSECASPDIENRHGQIADNVGHWCAACIHSVLAWAVKQGAPQKVPILHRGGGEA